MFKKLATGVCAALLGSGAFASPLPQAATPVPSTPPRQTVASATKPGSPPKKPRGIPIFVRSASSDQMKAAIRVTVNGALVNFGSGEPVESDGRILVPMRGVFEALGAQVKYDVKTQTINAVRGATTISIRPGDQTARVNGETRPLESVAQVVNGFAVVPLRFVSEALGAQVKWNPDTYEVAVRTEALNAMKLPTAPAGNSVFGSLTGVYPEAKMITVRLAGGNNVRVPLTYEVSATRRTLGNGLPVGATTATSPVFAADALKLGEQVQVEMNDSGEGLLVLVATDLRRGEVKSIELMPTNGGGQITLTDGTVITMLPLALVRYQNRPVPLFAIRPAEQIVVRLNQAGQGASLAVITPGAANAIPPLPEALANPASATDLDKEPPIPTKAPDVPTIPTPRVGPPILKPNQKPVPTSSKP